MKSDQHNYSVVSTFETVDSNNTVGRMETDMERRTETGLKYRTYMVAAIGELN